MSDPVMQHDSSLKLVMGTGRCSQHFWEEFSCISLNALQSIRQQNPNALVQRMIEDPPAISGDLPTALISLQCLRQTQEEYKTHVNDMDLLPKNQEANTLAIRREQNHTSK